MNESLNNLSYGNSVLYRMCQEQPLHKTIDVVKSKIWIIGRSYAASIERKAGKDFSIDDLAKMLINSDLDERIKKLNQESETSLPNIDLLLSTHKYLMGMFFEATKIEKRSLASKYLHFHAPKPTFIYDSIVRDKIRKELASIRKRFPVSKKFDDEYEAHVLRCIFFRDEVLLKSHERRFDTREIDSYLYGYEVHH